jgi:hypothetical protein
MWRKPPACVCGAASRSPVLPDEARDPHQGAAIRHAVARSETGHSRDRPQRGASLGPVSLACLFGLTVPALGHAVARSETGHSARSETGHSGGLARAGLPGLSLWADRARPRVARSARPGLTASRARGDRPQHALPAAIQRIALQGHFQDRID